jgi:hypothetical protein
MVPGVGERVPGQGGCSGTEAISECPYTSYRTSDDIISTFGHVANNANSLRPFLGDEARGDPPPRSRPGGWAYPDALQTGMLGTLSPSGYTPDPDGWSPLPLVEDRTDFGLHCITSSPLMLSFNVSNDTLVEMLWDIIANEEAIRINQHWAGSPGRLVTTIGPAAAAAAAVSGAATGASTTVQSAAGTGTWAAMKASSQYVLRKGQLGQVSGWGHNPSSARGLTCPTDAEQQPDTGTSVCNLLRVATCTLAEAQRWCTAHPECGAFSYRSVGQSVSTASGIGTGAANRTAVVYFKDATSIFFMDSNFRAGGQVQTGGGGSGSGGWLSQIKSEHAPPGSWREAPCAGTTCPADSPPCHTACLSIAPCCSAHGPTGEALEFADGVGQLWSKRLTSGAVAFLFVNLGKAPLTHSFTLEVSDL